MPFIPGRTPVPVSGKVIGDEEIEAGCRAVRAARWTSGGVETPAFERELADFIGVRCATMVNSGSSANLAAISALTSPELGDRRLRPGDEVITCGLAFPTTVAPIVQNQLVPVFIDCELPTYQLDAHQLEKARSRKTKAVVAAHTLGNPFDLDAVGDFCKRHGYWLIEDNCDALGSLWKGKRTGSFGHLSTLSFYPAHHMTCGEGGAVLTDDPKLARLVESFVSWGKHCWCAPGCDDTCGKRFKWELGEMPKGWDHKYLFSHLGYNLKATDIQAAIAREQLKRVPGFTKARYDNWVRLHSQLYMLPELTLAEASRCAEPSWFGFPIMVTKGDAQELIARLESKLIATRPIFAGDLTRQPCMAGVNYRKVNKLPVTQAVMESAFWVGVWPGLTDEMIDYIAAQIRSGITG